MICPKCHTENPDGFKFCNGCGQKLVLICPSCQTANPPGSRFCGECGHDLSKPLQTQALDYPVPKSYTPKFLAEKILTTRSAMEGERKLVRILFACTGGVEEAGSSASRTNLKRRRQRMVSIRG
jgi:hypothetical protein